MAAELSDLFGQIQSKGTSCLNEDPKNSLANVWLDDTSKFLQSDADEQLLLLIAFKGETKVRNFTITAPSDGSAPKSIKFFINKPDMNFDDASSFPATHAIELDKSYSPVANSNLVSATIELPTVKFQRVFSIALFVMSNVGGKDNTVINRLLFRTDKKQAQVEAVPFLATEAEFDEKIKEAGTKTMFVDFTASWCGPCKMISPVFAQLASQNPEAVFVKVDVDVNKPIAKRYGISAMPTFFAFKNGEKVAETRGADATGLTNMVNNNK